MRRSVLFITTFLIIFYATLCVASPVSATTMAYTPTSGADASTATPALFSLTGSKSDIAKLNASDNKRIQSNAPSWPTGEGYEEDKYIEFVFTPQIPDSAHIDNVIITHEFRRSGAMNGAKLEVWEGSQFTDYPLTVGAINVDHTDVVNVTSIINTPAKANMLKARFLAFRGDGHTKTSHDFIGLSISYTLPTEIVPTPIPTPDPVPEPTPAPVPEPAPAPLPETPLPADPGTDPVVPIPTDPVEPNLPVVNPPAPQPLDPPPSIEIPEPPIVIVDPELIGIPDPADSEGKTLADALPPTEAIGHSGGSSGSSLQTTTPVVSSELAIDAVPVVIFSPAQPVARRELTHESIAKKFLPKIDTIKTKEAPLVPQANAFDAIDFTPQVQMATLFGVVIMSYIALRLRPHEW